MPLEKEVPQSVRVSAFQNKMKGEKKKQSAPSTEAKLKKWGKKMLLYIVSITGLRCDFQPQNFSEESCLPPSNQKN